MRLRAALSFLALTASVDVASGAAQPAPRVFHGRSGAREVPIPRVDTAAVVDGVLDEPVWRRAALLTGFSQFFPDDQVAARDSTEVLVWYSATALHVGIRAWAPPGSVRATLADRDKITQDDNVQLFLGTYNDSRQALVFGVNPFGIQGDGVLIETGAPSGGGFMSNATTKARETTDLAPDYVWQSKGRLTPAGFEVELAIPFKSLRYRREADQAWQLNVVRTVQATGHEETWAPARRASASFLAQSGRLTGLRGLERGLTLDAIPTVTSSVLGTPPLAGAEPAPAWRYGAPAHELGGSVRWGITSNLTLAGTANPDFSQVEADATQYALDPRVAVYFPERRPFFLESQEQFTTPNRLIYTRRIAQPVAAAKLTGKHGGFDIGVLAAVDSRDAAADRRDAPQFGIVRLQRDVGRQSRVGMVLTDREEAGGWNRVLGADGRLVRGVTSVQWQAATSVTRRPQGPVQRAPLADLSVARNGRQYVARYAVNAISDRFEAHSGFIARPGIVNLSMTQRWNRFGAPGALVEVFSPELYVLGRWQYADFVRRRSSQDEQLHLRTSTRFRGGWQLGAQLLLERFGYDPALYRDYALLRPAPGGTRVDTLPYTGTAVLPNLDGVLSVTTPEFRRGSLTSVFIYGQDENFPEWSSARILNVQQTLNLRPTEQLRLNLTWVYEGFWRKTDGTRVLLRNTRRLRAEYQVTRQLFVRAIGEVADVEQDALRDDSRTGMPVFLRGAGGVLRPAAAFSRSRARLDFLVSYLPSPGTVFYLGYGDQLRADRPGGTETLRRSADAFFLKLSYLFRVQ
ncbi:MAG: carbohydrate binding family 9 domain-containing protein [Gemmatimonadetes bacterium]|nr:carbohydrate binding family 9 domain-containing protein [Gemmatimonadota bacterium]